MNTEGFSALVGLVLPVLVELINKLIGSGKKATFVIALITSILVGAITTSLTGRFNTEEVLGSIGIVFATSQAVYNLYWKESRFEAKIGKLVSRIKK